MAVKFNKLTRHSIRRLVTGEKITENGIMVERLSSGDIRYTVNVMVDGQRIHRVLGKQSDGITRTQCEEFISNTRAKAREGRLSLPAGRKTTLSFAAAADAYINQLEGSGGKNLANKRRHFKLYLKPAQKV